MPPNRLREPTFVSLDLDQQSVMKSPVYLTPNGVIVACKLKARASPLGDEGTEPHP